KRLGGSGRGVKSSGVVGNRRDVAGLDQDGQSQIGRFDGMRTSAPIGSFWHIQILCAGLPRRGIASRHYFPIQKVENILFKISSAVVAPVMASIGRSALYRSSSSISCGMCSRTAVSVLSI